MPVISLLAHSDSIIEIATITTNIINISQLSNDCIHRCLPPHHWLGAQFRLGGAALGRALTHLWLSTHGWMAPADMASLWMKDGWYGFLFEWRVSCCWHLCQEILMFSSKAIVPWLAGPCQTYVVLNEGLAERKWVSLQCHWQWVSITAVSLLTRKVLLTSMGTLELRVTVDSIRNSCNVSLGDPFSSISLTVLNLPEKIVAGIAAFIHQANRWAAVPIRRYLQYLFESGFPEREFPQSN